MNVESDIIEVLKNKHFDFFSYNDFKLCQIQENTFQLYNGNDYYFIKWFPIFNRHCYKEIQINIELLDKISLPSPKFHFVSKTKKGYFACWEWLEGFDLRIKNRHLLRDAFTMVGKFHLLYRYNGLISSPVTQNSYNSIKDMLNAEFEYLCSFFNLSTQKKCRLILSSLEVGYPTIIHGDLHPGNILFTHKGLQFIDWGCSIKSVNLFDLKFIQSIIFNHRNLNKWWIINPSESESVLNAYFDNCGISNIDYKQIHHAVMLWNELILHHLSTTKNNKTFILKCRRNIEFLLRN